MLLLALPVAGQVAPSSPAPTAGSLRAEADAQTLEMLLRDQTALLEALQSDSETTRLPEAEKNRRVMEIVNRYEAYLMARPNSVEGLILYGKFLRLVDAREEANKQFERASRLSPDTAVVQHQLGVYAAEEGHFRVALAGLGRAVELEPKAAVYHAHLGEFLATYQKHLVESALLTREVCDAKMQTAFLTAAELVPAEAGYRWRYAESFFDCARPNWARALAAWNSLAAEARSPLEKEVLGLYRARVLLELGRRAEAVALLEASKTPALETTRRTLRERLAGETDGSRKTEPASATTPSTIPPPRR